MGESRRLRQLERVMCCRLEFSPSFFSFPPLFSLLLYLGNSKPRPSSGLSTHTHKSGFDFPPGRDAMLTGDIHTRGKERKAEGGTPPEKSDRQSDDACVSPPLFIFVHVRKRGGRCLQSIWDAHTHTRQVSHRLKSRPSFPAQLATLAFRGRLGN